MYRHGDFVAYESSIAYLQDTVTNRPFFIGIPLRVVDSRGRVKVILFSSSSSDGDSGSDSKLLYHGERTRNVIPYEKGSLVTVS